MTQDRSIADSRRPTLYGRRHAISSGHYLASAAGYAILEAGGNAIDAGCAAGIALGVLHADQVNVAGVAPIMIRTGAGELCTIAGLGHWPSSFPADLFMREHGGDDPAWNPAHGRPGRARRLDHGIARLRDDDLRRYRRRSDPLCPRRASRSTSTSPTRSPSTSTITGAGPRARRSSCPAASRRGRAIGSSRANSPRRFSTWPTRSAPARAAGASRGSKPPARRFIAARSPSGSSATTSSTAATCPAPTLPRFHSRYEPPVRVRWRDFEVVTCGPWCQGPVLAQALLMLERAGIDGLGRDRADYAHLVLEVAQGRLLGPRVPLRRSAFRRRRPRGAAVRRVTSTRAWRQLIWTAPTRRCPIRSAPPRTSEFQTPRGRPMASAGPPRLTPPTCASSIAGATPSRPFLRMAPRPRR